MRPYYAILYYNQCLIFLKLNFCDTLLNTRFINDMPLMEVFQENDTDFSKRTLPPAMSHLNSNQTQISVYSSLPENTFS